jgi:hypothetical protein
VKSLCDSPPCRVRRLVEERCSKNEAQRGGGRIGASTLRSFFIPLFTRVRGNSHSPKFEVASDPPGAAPSIPQRHGGPPSAPKRGDHVPFVAPMCIKRLRLATSRPPEKSSHPRTGPNRTSSVRGSEKLACRIVHGPLPGPRGWLLWRCAMVSAVISGLHRRIPLWRHRKRLSRRLVGPRRRGVYDTRGTTTRVGAGRRRARHERRGGTMERRRVRPASGTAGPARAFLLTLAVGLLAGLLLGLLVGFFLGRIGSGGGGEQAAPPAPPARTVTGSRRPFRPPRGPSPRRRGPHRRSRPRLRPPPDRRAKHASVFRVHRPPEGAGVAFRRSRVLGAPRFGGPEHPSTRKENPANFCCTAF